VFSYLDWFNIMAYDDFTTTAPYKQHSDYSLTVTALNYWVGTRGMPKQKAVLGIPAYGRPSGITQTGTVLTYSGILGQGGSPLADSAIVTAAGFTNYKIYYNGQPTVKNKTMLAKTMGNGIMIWEKTQDTNDNTSLLKAACDTIGRPY
jgi:chitinase